jgi:surface protein
MMRMFRDATAFNQNISSWNTSAVTDMYAMFQDATAFNQNIGTWNVANVANFTNFMTGKTPATFSTTNLNAIYNGWSTQAVQSSLNISFGTAKYTVAASAGRAILTGVNLWSITDGGL